MPTLTETHRALCLAALARDDAALVAAGRQFRDALRDAWQGHPRAVSLAPALPPMEARDA